MSGVEHDVVKLTNRQHITIGLIRQFVVEHVRVIYPKKLPKKLPRKLSRKLPRKLLRKYWS